MKKGLFITIYGINNIGKSTHAKLLLQHLKTEGYDAVYLKYPIYNLEPTGPQLDKIIRSESAQAIGEAELQTIFMQNRKDFEPELRRMLDEGKIVVAEDYTGTGIAWGMAKGKSQTWMEDLNLELLKEDFTILMVGNRVKNAREAVHIHESDDNLLDKVEETLRKLGKEYGWHEVEQQQQKDDTAALIWREVEEFLEKRIH